MELLPYTTGPPGRRKLLMVPLLGASPIVAQDTKAKSASPTKLHSSLTVWANILLHQSRRRGTALVTINT